MILNSRRVKLASLEIEHEFTVVGSTPTIATISWLRDADKPELGTDSKTVPVTPVGDEIFSLTAAIPAKQYWVELDSESRKLRFDNVFNDDGDVDRELAWSGNASVFHLYIPYCDVAAMNIELFTVDGDKLDAFRISPKFWYLSDLLIFDGYSKPKLCYKVTVSGADLRLGDGAWRRQADYSSFYVRVSNVRNIITNDILLSTVVDPDDYTVEYQDKKDKTKKRTANWGCTISS
jgi:hypothetical protein